MRIKRKCELCSNVAKIYCESDQASLCYECDSKVHSANFLVSKHSRTLLCYVCQSPTLWTGSGPKFGPTISVCPTCLKHRDVKNGDNHEEDEDLDDDNDGDGSNEDDDDDDDDDDDGDNAPEEDESHNGDDSDHEEDEENQVVPWSYSVSHPR